VLLIVVALFNVAFPKIFNVDTKVAGLLNETIAGGLDIALWFKLVNAVSEPIILPGTFNVPAHVVAPFNFVIPATFKLERLV
jgi:hypothetical protein